MKTVKVCVLLNSIERVKRFSKHAEKFDSGDIDIVSGRYTIDGKSIMGIFSLDLSKELNVTLNAESMEDIQDFLRLLKEEKIEWRYAADLKHKLK